MPKRKGKPQRERIGRGETLALTPLGRVDAFVMRKQTKSKELKERKGKRSAQTALKMDTGDAERSECPCWVPPGCRGVGGGRWGHCLLSY